MSHLHAEQEKGTAPQSRLLGDMHLCLPMLCSFIEGDFQIVIKMTPAQTLEVRLFGVYKGIQGALSVYSNIMDPSPVQEMSRNRQEKLGNKKARTGYGTKIRQSKKYGGFVDRRSSLQVYRFSRPAPKHVFLKKLAGPIGSGKAEFIQKQLLDMHQRLHRAVRLHDLQNFNNVFEITPWQPPDSDSEQQEEDEASDQAEGDDDD